MDLDVTAITVNFKTAQMTYAAVNSFRKFYKDLPYILVDNGGCDESLKLWRKMAAKGFLYLVKNEENIGHGPALDQALGMVETGYAFLLDSDTRTDHGGFLEKMLALFAADPQLFAAGPVIWVNAANGITLRPGDVVDDVLWYVHLHACLLDVDKYSKCKPFTHSGAPGWPVYLDARERGWTVTDFAVKEYVWHRIAGTRGLYGGRIRVGTDERPGQWQRRKI